jgi:hypothetical protein
MSEAGPPASWRGEPGQIRKEAATAISRECRGKGSPLHFLSEHGSSSISA